MCCRKCVSRGVEDRGFRRLLHTNLTTLGQPGEPVGRWRGHIRSPGDVRDSVELSRSCISRDFFFLNHTVAICYLVIKSYIIGHWPLCDCSGSWFHGYRANTRPLTDPFTMPLPSLQCGFTRLMSCTTRRRQAGWLPCTLD